jgi:HAMP domain-containing protein
MRITENPSVLRPTIRKRILGIAIGLIFLMAITSALSTVMTRKIAHQLDELSTKYIEAYGHLARMNVRSLEQALALRRMAISKMQMPPDNAGFVERQKIYEGMWADIDREAKAARALINAIIDDTSTESDNAKLGRIDDRIEHVSGDLRRYLDDEYKRLLPLLESGNFSEARASLIRSDTLRDEFNRKIDEIRSDMLGQVRADAKITMRDQNTAIVISVILTVLASVAGLLFSLFVSTGITRPVRRLLEGTRAVEAGRLDASIDVTTRDEIGQLTTAFNNMVEQLRHKEHLRETFGRYVDPRVVEGLIAAQSLTASDGERRVMTVLFCDMKGFTGLSEGMTPQGLVKVMNHYPRRCRDRSAAIAASSTNILATRSWPIGALRLPSMANRRGWPVLPRSKWRIVVRRCAPNCLSCSACAPCRATAKSASVSRRARFWSAASARNS